MGIFRRETDQRSVLLKLKTIKIAGMEFTIKPVNPLLDFPTDKIPQIFTNWQTARKIDPKAPEIPDLKRMQEDMYSIVSAGLESPKLSRKSSDGIIVEDLFRDPAIGVKLYYAILEHSLNKFRGLRRVFFSIGIKLSELTLFASGMVSDLQHTSSAKAS